MINFTHDATWQAELQQAIQITTNSLQYFGRGEAKEIPAKIAKELNAKSSDYFRFIEVFYDETLLDAEIALSAEAVGNKELGYEAHAIRKKAREENQARFTGIMNQAYLFCKMSPDYGCDFVKSIHDIVESSLAYPAFLFQFYDTVMSLTRFAELIEKQRGEANARVKNKPNK